MAIGSIGAIAYANQSMPAQTKMQSNLQNRLDMQNEVATSIQNADKKEIEDIRPAEESYKIDPDHEHERSKSDEREKNSKNEEPKKQSKIKKEFINIITPKHLDIKV